MGERVQAADPAHRHVPRQPEGGGGCQAGAQAGERAGTHPDGEYHNDVFTAERGDLVFAPTGLFHYFENASTTEPLDVLIVFNTSTAEPDDDVGIVGSLNAIPRDVLAASFGVPESAFAQVPQRIEPVVITRRR